MALWEAAAGGTYHDDRFVSQDACGAAVFDSSTGKFVGGEEAAGAPSPAAKFVGGEEAAGAAPSPAAEPEEDEASGGLRALTLDEVSYDRHIDWCSKPASARTRSQPATTSRLFAAAADGAKRNAADYSALDAKARAASAIKARRDAEARGPRRRPTRAPYQPPSRRGGRGHRRDDEDSTPRPGASSA